MQDESSEGLSRLLGDQDVPGCIDYFDRDDGCSFGHTPAGTSYGSCTMCPMSVIVGLIQAGPSPAKLRATTKVSLSDRVSSACSW